MCVKDFIKIMKLLNLLIKEIDTAINLIGKETKIISETEINRETGLILKGAIKEIIMTMVFNKTEVFK